MEVVSYGTGLPALFNDEVLIPNMLQLGYTLEEARDYAIIGCTETTVPAVTEPWLTGGFLNLLKVLEFTIFDGFDPVSEKRYALRTGEVERFQDFESFFDAYLTEAAKYRNPRSGRYNVALYSIATHVLFAGKTGATPDGRKKGAVLADGGVSCGHGLDTQGLTALLKSVAKLDPYKATGSTLLNVKLSPSLLHSQSFQKTMDVIKTYFHLKGQHIQFNDPLLQEDIIRRTEHGSGDDVPGGTAKFRGLVFDIQRFCLHDGPGVRTVVFLKGCTLRCLWCANPESQEFSPELLYDSVRCVGCGTCLAVCPAGALAKRLSIEEIDLFPFHRLGTGKYRRLGRVYDFADTLPLNEAELEKIKRCIETESGSIVRIIV
jgi:ferredoxin